MEIVWDVSGNDAAL